MWLSIFYSLCIVFLPLLTDAALRQFRYAVSVIDQPYPNRLVLGLNGRTPGPALVCREGDDVEVLITNEFTADQRRNYPYLDNTTIHWHGIDQSDTPMMDGVPGLTQCVIPDGQQLLYRFNAKRAGTFWLHGHYHDQWANGLIAPLIVKDNTPSHAYDGEIIWLISEWYNQDYRQWTKWFMSNASNGEEPLPDALMVNGKFTGTLFTHVPRNSKIRIRIINACAISMLRISVDGCFMDIIEADSVKTEPLRVSNVTINVAQRASVLVDFSQQREDLKQHDSFFFRVEFMKDMFPDRAINSTTLIPQADADPYQPPAAFSTLYLGTISYQPLTTQLPTYGFDDAAMPTAPLTSNSSIVVDPHPADMNHLDARPVDWLPAPQPTLYMDFKIEFQEQNGIVLGFINGVGYSEYHSNRIAERPLLYYFVNNPVQAIPMPTDGVIRSADNNGLYYFPYGQTVEMLINNTDNGGHPFHIHSHNLWIIATSDYPEAAQLGPNYLRRDTVNVPASGWARVRFTTDQPGVWLIHCHILAHQHSGLQAVFIVAPDMLSQDYKYFPPLEHLQICDHQFTVTPPEYAGNAVNKAMMSLLNSGKAGVAAFAAIVVAVLGSVVALCSMMIAAVRYCVMKRRGASEAVTQDVVLDDSNLEQDEEQHKQDKNYQSVEVASPTRCDSPTRCSSPTRLTRQNQFN